jgi:hypothetical protein
MVTVMRIRHMRMSVSGFAVLVFVTVRASRHRVMNVKMVAVVVGSVR